MARPRIHIVRLVTFFVALQILNMGCFVQEFDLIASSPVTPQLNIINTIDEYIAEVVLDHKDAVPETGEHSKKDVLIHKHAASKLISISRPAIASNAHAISSVQLFEFSNTYSFQFFEDITPPPPKQVS